MRSRAQFTGRVPPVAEILACVVFDPSTGSIAHVHRTVRFEGAEPVSKEDLAAQAVEMAGRHHMRGGLEVLQLAGEDLELEPDVEYAVDLQSKRLTQRRRFQLLKPSNAPRRLPRWLGYFLAALLGAVIGLVLFRAMT